MQTFRLVFVPVGMAILAATSTAQTKVDFGRDVLPVLRQNCFGCHGPAQQEAGLRFDRRSSVMKGFSRRVVPGSSENSFVYHRLVGSEFGPQMPPTGPLRSEQIAIIKNWIDQGAVWPDSLANEGDKPPIDRRAVAMVESLRNDDLAGFLKSAADPKLLNGRGPEGSTPFMYAVLYSNAATVDRLLKMGADPNKRNDANATALMWAAKDLEKTRLLVEHGADVNAKSDDMRTPLMIAARKPGGAPIVKYLLEHGANPNPNAQPLGESCPLTEAVTAGDAAITELLVSHGADVKAAGQPALTMAITTGCARCVDLIMPKITDKAVLTGSLQDTAVYGDVRSVRMLLDRGADVNAADPLGRTPLMYAAVSDVFPLEEVKLLIEHGANVNAKDQHTKSADAGLTPLDIAKLNGNTAIIDLLLKSGAKPGNVTPVSLKPRTGNTIRSAVQDSLPLLQRSDVNFANNSGCISCHNNNITAMTIGLARRRGIHVDESAAATDVKANVLALQKLRDRLHQGFMFAVGDNFGEDILAYMLLGLDAGGYKPDLDTDAAVYHILTRQTSAGNWPAPTADGRPPICLDYIGQTAISMRSLQLYAPKANHAAFDKAIQLAASWLAKTQPLNNDDRAWRVAGLAWAGTDKAATQKAIQEMLATQRPDGGWSDLPSMPSNAYETGRALVALQIAGVKTTEAAYERGVKYLLTTQQQDGSWYVKTRALAIQPYFDAGFPHGHDQWISTAATGWAAMALTLTMPETTQRAAR